MNIREFRRVGHWPTLLCAFLYFDFSFMVWVLLGALANYLVPEFQLSAAERGLMVAVPLLGGSLLRLLLGLSTDQLGARLTGIIGLVLTVVPLLLGWLWVDSYGKLLLVGILLGVAGASFAVALPLASRWYPPRHQGLAMGIAAAGNSGTALATFFGPRLAAVVGWQAVFGLALAPLVLVLAVFTIFAKDSPSQPSPPRLADYTEVLRHPDTWWFSWFYAVTFGGFVGLASYLSIFFHDRYGLSPVQAGSLATLCVIAGSCVRPIGGHLADRVGGIHVLAVLYVGIAVGMLDLATSPPLLWGTFLMVAVMSMLGLGNGAVFQLVPQRFSKEIGVVSGIVGAAGGLGGFFLPTLLGGVKQLTGSFSGGFLIFAAVSFGSMIALVNVSQAWEGVFIAKGGLAASSE